MTLRNKDLSSESSNNIKASYEFPTSLNLDIPIVEIDLSSTIDDFQNLEFHNLKPSPHTTSTTISCHNFDLESSSVMEANFKNVKVDKKVSREMVDLSNLITLLSKQISNQTTFIQEQLCSQNGILQDQAA